MNKKIYLIFSLFFSLLQVLPCQGSDFYLWQRIHTDEVQTAIRDFYSQSKGKLYCIAGEVNKSGIAISIKPSAAISLDRSAAVIRIHTGALEANYGYPIRITDIIVDLFAPWQPCKALEIDLDIPESQLNSYADLLLELRKMLPDVTLSATVLPCHLKHRSAFSRLAYACDFYVLQVHGLNKDKGYWSIFDYSESVKAVEKARSFKRPFKVALPLYCNNLARNLLVKPDLQKVSVLAKTAPQVIGFRLGVAGDGNSLDWQTASAVCQGKGYQPRLQMQWQLQSNGAWILNVKNIGYFAEKITLQLSDDLRKIMSDADTFNNALFDKRTGTVQLRLPPANSEIKVMWGRFSEDPNKQSPITIKE